MSKVKKDEQLAAAHAHCPLPELAAAHACRLSQYLL